MKDHILRTNLQCKQLPAIDSSVGRVLRRSSIAEVISSNPRSGLNFFQTAAQVVCVTAMINQVFK